MTTGTGAHPKPWWQSRAIIGAVVVVVAQGVRLAGWEVDSQATTDAITSGLTVIGAALAWWGRVKATKPISRRRVAPGIGRDDPIVRPSKGQDRPSQVLAKSGRPASGRSTDPRGAFSDREV